MEKTGWHWPPAHLPRAERKWKSYGMKWRPWRRNLTGIMTAGSSQFKGNTYDANGRRVRWAARFRRSRKHRREAVRAGAGERKRHSDASYEAAGTVVDSRWAARRTNSAEFTVAQG